MASRIIGPGVYPHIDHYFPKMLDLSRNRASRNCFNVELSPDLWNSLDDHESIVRRDYSCKKFGTTMRRIASFEDERNFWSV